MKPLTRTLPIVAVLLAVFLLFGSAVQAAGPVTEDNIGDRITAAKSANDHQAIATFFRAKAAASGEEAKRHEKMSAEYAALSSYNSMIMRDHCKPLIESNRKAQESYEALASDHEKLAKEAAR
jgi:hypothetical protein